MPVVMGALETIVSHMLVLCRGEFSHLTLAVHEVFCALCQGAGVMHRCPETNA